MPFEWTKAGFGLTALVSPFAVLAEKKHSFTWEEERTPIRGTYEFEAHSGFGLGVFTNLPQVCDGRYPSRAIRRRAFGELHGFCQQDVQVAVNVETILGKVFRQASPIPAANPT